MKIYLETVMRHKASCDLQDIPLAQGFVGGEGNEWIVKGLNHPHTSSKVINTTQNKFNVQTFRV